MGRRVGLLAVALIAFAGIGFVGWKVLGTERDSGPQAMSSGSDEAHAATRTELAPEAITAPASGATEELAATSVDEQEGARSSAIAEEHGASGELQDAIWVEGRVLFPDRTPPDEQAYVIAHGKSFETLKSYRARVAPDGTFRVAFHPKTRSKRARLELDARYMYMDLVKLDPRTAGSDLVLQPRLGGWLSVLLHPPVLLRDDDLRPEEISLAVIGDHRDNDKSGSLEDGIYRFELGGLPPDSYWLHMDAEGWANIGNTEVTLAAGEHAELELQATLGVQLRGRVVDEEGHGVGHVDLSANVKSETNGVSWFQEFGGTSADDGTFAILGIQPGTLELTAQRDQYLPFETELGDHADRARIDGVEIVLGRGLTIAGKVVWPNGEGADEARVRIERDVQGRRFNDQPTVVKTETDGSFAVSGFDAGAYQLLAECARPEPAHKETTEERRERKRMKLVAQLEQVQAGNHNVVLMLDTGQSLAGTVVDDQGNAVESFSVHFQRMDSSAGFGSSTRRRFKDPGGRFTLEGLGAGHWVVQASSRDHAPGPEVRIELPDDTDEIQLRVQRGVKITGRVTDSAGQPIEDAHVRANLQQQRSLPRHAWSHSETRTAADGTYTLDELSPGPLLLACSAPGYAQKGAEALNLSPGEQRTDMLTILQSGGRILGSLDPSALAELKDQNVFAENERGYWKFTTTDTRGRFEFTEVPPGKTTVNWEHSHGSYRQEVDVPEGGTVEIVLGQTKKGGTRIFGRVTRGDIGVADIRVEVAAMTGATRTLTDAAGNYELYMHKLGTCTLSVWAGSVGTSRTIEVGDSEQRVDFALGAGVIQGHVLAPDGSPAVDLLLNLGPTEGTTDQASLESDDDGAFRFEGLSPGTYTLSAQSWRAYTGVQPYASPRMTLVLGETPLEGVVLQLVEPCTIQGMVRRPDGSPAVGAHIALTPRSGTEGPTSGMRSDAAGRFEGYVSEGMWTAQARLDGLVSTSKRGIEARIGASVDVDLELAAGTIVQVVIDGVSTPILPALTDAAGQRHSTYLNSTGVPLPAGVELRGARVGPVPPGIYTVEAASAESPDQKVSASVTLNGEPFREVVLSTDD